MIWMGLLLVFWAVFGMIEVYAEPEEEEEITYTDASLRTDAGELPGLEEMHLVVQDGTYALYANVDTGEVAVAHLSTGNVWLTNPTGAASDEASAPIARNRMASQLILSYHDEKANEYTINSYEECIELDQLTYRMLENGIEFRYVVGEMEESIIIPRWISEERMEAYLEQMSEADEKFVRRQYRYYNLEEIRERDKKEYLETYPILEEHPIWVLRDNATYIQEEMMDIFGELGYDREQLVADCEENGYTSDRFKPYFVVPLSYEFKGGELVVSIDAARVEYDELHYPLVDITVLPYFGAASEEEEGYLFVPDGSGALIAYNSGMRTTPQYQQKVYGEDLSSDRLVALESEEQWSIKMPVFGLKTGSQAMFSIIEDGDALATIYGNTSGKTDRFNVVYASFSYCPYGPVSLDGADSANKLFMFANNPYQGQYAIRYLFLEGGEASYSGMAKAYQSYLLEKGVLEENELTGAVPFYLDVIGAVNIEKKFLGVPYHATQVLTTYAQTGEILSALSNGEVEHLILTYHGWYNGGLRGTIATDLDLVNKLGSREELNTLLEELSQNENKYYFAVDLQYVYQNKLFDDYTSSGWAPRYFDKSAFGVREYSVSIGRQTGKLADLVRLSKMEKLKEKFLKEEEKLKMGSYQVGTIANTLYSDFTAGAQYNRQEALETNKKVLSGLKEAGLSLMGDNAAVYAWDAVEDITGIPLFSNHYSIITQEVPFYAMVLHGYREYAGEALNQTDDYETAWLKSVESGAGLSFLWIYENNTVLKDSDYMNLYSITYDVWLEEGAAMYRRMNEEMGHLNDVPISDHYLPAQKVTVTVYEDGTKVYVNYNDTAVTVEGIDIPARDFRVAE